MRPLSAPEIVHIWELGLYQHPIDRALTILAPAYPEMTRDDLAELSIGKRDAHLLTLREQTFGGTLYGLAACPQCSEPLEFSVSVGDIRTEPESDAGRSPTLNLDDHMVEFRLPNSRDLAVAAECEDIARARSALLERCVVHAAHNDSQVKPTDLPDKLVTELAEKMDEWDPQANVMLDLQCPQCANSWQLAFDIVSFLWSEIACQAKRLLSEVHTLSSTYGWSEQAILSLSSIRRRSYLEMVL